MANEKRLDLIDRNVLKALFDVRYDTAFIQERTRENKEQWNGYCAGINWGRNTIADAPTVDAVEVVHGRWVLEQKFEDGTADYKCSVCEYDDTFNCNLVNAFYKYCPYCGAKMDGGDDNGC